MKVLAVCWMIYVIILMDKFIISKTKGAEV